jgi:hypothetical protein
VRGLLWNEIPLDAQPFVKRTKWAVFILDMVVKNRHIALFTHIPEQLRK